MIHQFLVSINTKEHHVLPEDLHGLVDMVIQDLIHRHYPPDVTCNVRPSNLQEVPKPKPANDNPTTTADWFHCDVYIEQESDKAFLVQINTIEGKHWIPKTQVADASSYERRYRGSISITRWFAEKAGFIS